MFLDHLLPAVELLAPVSAWIPSSKAYVLVDVEKLSAAARQNGLGRGNE
jgi:hypothetical protein